MHDQICHLSCLLLQTWDVPVISKEKAELYRVIIHLQIHLYKITELSFIYSSPKQKRKDRWLVFLEKWPQTLSNLPRCLTAKEIEPITLRFSSHWSFTEHFKRLKSFGDFTACIYVTHYCCFLRHTLDQHYCLLCICTYWLLSALILWLQKAMKSYCLLHYRIWSRYLPKTCTWLLIVSKCYRRPGVEPFTAWVSVDSSYLKQPII